MKTKILKRKKVSVVKC